MVCELCKVQIEIFPVVRDPSSVAFPGISKVVAKCGFATSLIAINDRETLTRALP